MGEQLAGGCAIALHATARNDLMGGCHILVSSSLFQLVHACIVFAVLHRNHVAGMFESDRHFSHLADFEREMTYRTEMGLYYSYYKTLIEAPTLVDGFHQITQDNITEYGHTINTLKRFNLYPEVILAAHYRLFKRIAAALDWKTEDCWQVNRGQGLPPISSCEGIGNPHYFYIDHVFAVAGTAAAALFWLGVLVSDSIFGGFITIASFFFNHGEATRVQWTPPLRESFAYPVFIAQILVVSYILKYRKTGISWSLLLSALTLTFMLFWQFAQFALTTQVGSLFATFLLDFISRGTMKTIIYGHLMAFLSGFVLLFGNEMLLTSFFLSSVVTTMIILALDGALNKITFRPLLIIIQAVIFVAGTLGIKLGFGHLLAVEDDAHIFEILRAKFSDFANFHTRLYTCAPEFDFLGYEAPRKLMLTMLLPSAILAICLFGVFLLRSELSSLLWRTSSPIARVKPHSELVYNVVQLACFTVMAVLIMRLKLFWTPHLCVVAAMLANRQLIESALGSAMTARLKPVYHKAALVALLSAMAYRGYTNLNDQWNIRGEYSNPSQEMLFDWILKNTDKNAVFAGTMPVMANLKLSTNRPIVNHPHYEDVGIRERTMRVYSMFSRKSPEEVHATLKNMGVNYFVFEYGWCGANQQKPQCSYPAIWDLVDPVNKGKPALCDIVNNAKTKTLGPFQIVYAQQGYKLLKVQ
uniref:Uncharacterized protein n=1 Tax=Plectus sambesii TaxID=2011161 RepID=A0A914UJ24_9BILA